MPKRWLDDYGKRPLSPVEVVASVHYYRTLAHHLGIREVPETYAGFEALLDTYEAEHFAPDPGGRAVADATLALMTTFHPRLAARPAEVFARALMDQPLRSALGYAAPPPALERAARAGLKARGVLLRAFPARRRPRTVRDLGNIRSRPADHRVAELGTFPTPGLRGCPVKP